MKELVKSAGNMASSKWTWGVDLTTNDLNALIRGADHGQILHMGYDLALPSNSLHSATSAALDPDNLEDPSTTHRWFDKPSSSIASFGYGGIAAEAIDLTR
jgi:hypothetical protein